MWPVILIAYGLVGLTIITCTRARTFLRDKDVDSRRIPMWKFLAFHALVIAVALLFWPFFLRTWFARPRMIVNSRSGVPFEKYFDEVPMDWLTKPTSIKEVEAAETCDDPTSRFAGIPFGYGNPYWKAFLSKLKTGDELWSFHASGKSAEHDATGDGVAIVRGGKVVAQFTFPRPLLDPPFLFESPPASDKN